MKLQITLVVLLNLFGQGFAQDNFTPKEPRWKQLSQGYGFLLGQEATVASIEQKFPSLTKTANEARFVFDSSAVGESRKGVETELTILMGDKWPEFKAGMASDLKNALSERAITEKQASEFLAEMKARAKGQVPDGILASLLSAHSRYSANPALEMTEGWKRQFRSEGLEKAKDVDFSISVPVSWSARDGNRPNILQVFQSQAGHGPAMCNLIVAKLPSREGTPILKEDMKAMVGTEALKETVPKGGTFVSAKEIELEGAPGGVVVYDITEKRLDVEISMRRTHFVVLYQNSMVMIQFSVSKLPSTKETIEEAQNRFMPTFLLIANSLIMNDRYK